ncbi:hypothetical protein ACH5A3_37645 [Streptomyces echinatus]|uniref:hypothetical protein n=1 Tax=Streptomyces echinatus TaxID=67293 RepID=UPI00378B5191
MADADPGRERVRDGSEHFVQQFLREVSAAVVEVRTRVEGGEMAGAVGLAEMGQASGAGLGETASAPDVVGGRGTVPAVRPGREGHGRGG